MIIAPNTGGHDRCFGNAPKDTIGLLIDPGG